MNLKVIGKRFVIFMGDHGSMFCGYIVAWCLIYFAMERADYMNPITAVWIVGFVLFNAISTIIIRLVNTPLPPAFLLEVDVLFKLVQDDPFHDSVALLVPGGPKSPVAAIAAVSLDPPPAVDPLAVPKAVSVVKEVPL